MIGDQAELPPGWVWATVGDVGEYLNGCAFSANDWDTQGLPIIRIQNLTRPETEFNYIRGPVEPRYHVSSGTLLVSWSATLGVFRWAGPAGVLNQHIFKVEPNRALVDEGYLFYALKMVINDMREGAHLHGSTMKHINRGPFLAHRLPLPPHAEQRRIVAKLDELLDRSHVAWAALDMVPILLEQYRQARLAAAVRGAECVALGKVLAEPLINGRSVPTADEGFPVLRLTAIRNGLIDVNERKNGAWSINEARPYMIREGDFLVSRGNGSLSLVGRGGIVMNAPDAVAFPDTMIRVRPDKAIMTASFLRLVWDSPAVRCQIESSARTTAGIFKINQSLLERVRVPLLPIDAQLDIVRHVDAVVASTARQHGVVKGVLTGLENLQRTTLLKAFRGELVLQDPADEPASALLARIRSERVYAPALRARRRTPAKV